MNFKNHSTKPSAKMSTLQLSAYGGIFAILIGVCIFSLSSCSKKVPIQHEKIITSCIVFEDHDLKKMTPQMLIDTLKKYPNDIFIIRGIPSNFCNQQFIDELNTHVNDKTNSAEIRSGNESLRLIYIKTNVSSEVKLLLERIKEECE